MFLLSDIPSQIFLKKSIYKRFLHLRNTLHIALCLLFTPHLNLTDLHISRTAVVVLYCPGPRSPRGGTSLEISLALLHPLNDHLTVHVAHPNRVVSSCQQQQVDQGMGY